MAAAASFATAADLADRLGQSEPADDTQWQKLLEDASAFLRGEIGWQVYPPVAVTFRDPEHCTGGRWLTLPGAPITAFSAATIDGVSVAADAELIDGRLYLLGGWHGDVSVTYTVGYAAAPDSLVGWACVLASQALAMAGDRGALGAAGVTSEQTGGVATGYATDETVFSLPRHVLDSLRAQFGTSVYVTGS